MQSPQLATVHERLDAIRARISRACERAGRDPASVTLIGVTKTFPVPSIVEAFDAGLVDFGENRAQELLPKIDAVAALGRAPRWHFIGHLQRNKVRDVLPHIAALHSLDSARLAGEIEREAARLGTLPLRCYIEVNVAGEDTKQGVDLAGLGALVERVRACGHLELVGLMTVAPQVTEPEDVRPVFRRLRELAGEHGLTGLSMGMSEDFEVAIEEGSTAVRVGRAVFGTRL